MADQKPREIAKRILARYGTAPAYIEKLLEEAWAETPLAGPDRALCQELVYGVVRWQATLDWLIDRKTGRRPQKPALRHLLWLGLYQLFWLDRIPAHAAVHETVELAKASGFGPQAGFINAILRGYTREMDATRKLLQELKTTQPSIGYSHPVWLCERWQKRWGSVVTAQLLDWNNSPPPTYARANSLRPESAALPTIWQAEGVEAAPVTFPWTEGATIYELKRHPSLATLPSFQKGLFYVQDPSTLLATVELAPLPGELVLDQCAAPGGKTTHLAALMENRGRIFASDPDPGRLERLRENCLRLGARCVELVSHTFSPSEGPLPAAFDRILIDAPCSNTGVMRRRVDLRWRVRPEEIQHLSKCQLEILRDAAPRLKPGGVLVYSTCSLETEENRGVIDKFLTAHPTMRLDRERELTPFKDGVDGAYVARLTSAP